MWLSIWNPQVIILGLYRWRKWGGKKSDFQLSQDNRYLKCMKLIKFYVLLFGNLGFRLISTEYAAAKITPLVTTKGPNLSFALCPQIYVIGAQNVRNSACRYKRAFTDSQFTIFKKFSTIASLLLTQSICHHERQGWCRSHTSSR